MKTLTVLFALLLVLLLPQTVLAQESLLKNGNFEKFTGDVPEGWDVNNIPGTLTVVSAAKTSYSGMKAVKLEVKDFYGSVITGYICQKNVETSGRDLQISGFFALQSVGKDQGVMIFCFQNAGGSTIGSVEEYIDDSKGKFVRFSKEIKAPPGAAVVHFRVTILPDKGNEKVHPGTTLICDELKLAAVTIKEKPLIQ